MDAFLLPKSAHFAKVVVGWDNAVPGFFLKCFRKNEGDDPSVSFWTSALKTLDELERVLLSIDIELALPSVVHCYLAAKAAQSEADCACFEPLVASYRV
jgi:hypothetical protein